MEWVTDVMSWPDAYVARFILNKSVNIKEGMDIVSRSNLTISTSRRRKNLDALVCSLTERLTAISLGSSSQSTGRPSPAFWRRCVGTLCGR
jgi:hypothetical protein